MTKRWGGQTPYDGWRARAAGYRDAMNSRVVVGAIAVCYSVAKEVPDTHGDYLAVLDVLVRRAAAAVAAYEAGLREEEPLAPDSSLS